MKTWKNLKEFFCLELITMANQVSSGQIEWGSLYCTSLTIVKVNHIPVHMRLVSSYKMHYTYLDTQT